MGIKKPGKKYLSYGGRGRGSGSGCSVRSTSFHFRYFSIAISYSSAGREFSSISSLIPPITKRHLHYRTLINPHKPRTKGINWPGVFIFERPLMLFHDMVSSSCRIITATTKRWVAANKAQLIAVILRDIWNIRTSVAIHKSCWCGGLSFLLSCFICS